MRLIRSCRKPRAAQYPLPQTQYLAATPYCRQPSEPDGSALFQPVQGGREGDLTVARCNMESVMSIDTARREARVG